LETFPVLAAFQSQCGAEKANLQKEYLTILGSDSGVKLGFGPKRPLESFAPKQEAAERRRRDGAHGMQGMDAMSKKILIVEDNELNMKLFHDLLDAHGYQTIQTRDGMEALDLARTPRPDLILMDIQLPEVSGLEVTKWLKEDDGLKAIPVIAVTAFAMKGDEEKIREGGCEAYISKPISVSHFLETVRKFLA
jgi:two-component system, cell cycle response regulator DivK